jgi:hypothetical protein
MSLADRLNAEQEPDARRAREDHPKGFEPGARYEAGEPAEVVVRLVEIPENEQRWRAEIERVTSMPIPEHRRVELSQVRYWGDKANPFIYCRFVITNRPDARPEIDAIALLKALRPRRKAPTAFTGDTSLVVSWNDWQTGKIAGGGTPALAERLDAAYDAVRDRARELRKTGRDLGQLVVLGGGDMIEGCTIFPNQSYEIDTDRRSQIRNTVALGLEGLDRLAPLFERVVVLVVGGNHGEHRIGGHRVNRHDNDDAAVFEHMAVAASRDTRLGHVNFVIALDEPAKTLDVDGWVLGTTHGQVFGRGAGSVEQKAWNWFRNQAAGRQPVGDADVLVTHHFHHYSARDWGACQWVQTPAMDGGSAHFTDYSGQEAAPGMLSFVMSPEKRLADLQIL